MKKLLLSGVVFAALAVGPALAADMPRKAPVYMPPPPPVLNWTGFYVGLNAGYGWGNNDGIDNTVNSVFCNVALVGCAPLNFGNAAGAAVPLSFDSNPKGFIGGGQIGYNIEMNPWVWGIEADFQGANIHGDASAAGAAVPVGFPGNTVTIAGTGDQKINFLGTLRGRLGWLPVNPLLLYVTGGLAYGHVETNVSFTDHVSGPCFCGPNGFTSASNDQWRAGWTLGGGLEWMFAPRWSLKGEYLYYDLGHVTVNSQLVQLNGAGVPFFGTNISSEVHYKGSIVRAGVNYHF